MQIKNIKIFDSTNALNGSWIDVSNLVSISVQLTGLDASNVFIEASNDPYVTFDGANGQISAPSAPALSQGPAAFGGLKNQGTYYVKTTFVTRNGETQASSESSLAVTDGNVLMVQSPTDATGIAIGYNVYVGQSTGNEVLQSTPAYTPGWKLDANPGSVKAGTTGGAIPLGRNFYLQNGFNNSGIVVPAADTSGGPNKGVNISGTITSTTFTAPATGTGLNNTQVVLDTSGTNKMAMLSTSGLTYKFIRVVKATNGTVETIAWLTGQQG
jgi:hypothetical protein